MFTGLVEEVGRVTGVEVREGSARLSVTCHDVLDDLALGASIALDGCCVTVAERDDDGFHVDLMAPTLAATALGRLRTGDRVNLERAMRADARFGGHLVQGHVDAVGEVVTVSDDPGTRWLTVRVPVALLRYVVAKGSLCVSGVSLTVAGLDDDRATMGLIPHTLGATTLGGLAVGDAVNLEVDVVAKYVERMLPPSVAVPGVDA
jgi:riboflavin synthase